MKKNSLKTFFVLSLLEGFFAEFFLLRMKFDPGRGHILNYAYLKWGLAGITLLVLLAMSVVLIGLFREKSAQKIMGCLDEKLAGPEKRLFTVQGFLVIALVFCVECFLLTYVSFPVPLRPLLAWAALICFQAWLALRLGCQALYRQRPSLFSNLRAKWRAWMPVQRRVFIILAVLGLIYFLAFVPANYLRDKETHFYVHPDEDIIYPDVAKVLLEQNTFEATVSNVLVNWQWWYGYPYLVISAAVLLIPRLIFGSEFAGQMQLNIFLLRQFVSVLPMIVSVFMLVYIVTRFKSWVYSLSMYVFLLLVPGVVKYCYRFWHPDSLILLLAVLTVFFLQRDRLRFKRDFYLAAVTCGLAVAIKLWGFFFFLAIGGYLIVGLLRRALTFKQVVLAGLLFILVMSLTVVFTSPSLFVPSSFNTMLVGLQSQNVINTQGYNETDPEGVYQTGLTNWLRFFEMYFMPGWFFYFAFLGLVLGSLLGSETSLNRILLAWCLVTTFYLVTFLSVKSFHYMLPAMVPLYASAFLFPAITEEKTYPGRLSFLGTPLARKVFTGITVLMLGSQFIFNLIDIFTSPAIGVFTKI